MAKQITKYDAAWNPKTHQGVILLQFAGGPNARWETADAAEFSAMLSVLRHERPALVKGWFATGSEHSRVASYPLLSGGDME
jgi:hypothetical protein